MWIERLSHYDRQINEVANALKNWSDLLAKGQLVERCQVQVLDQLEQDISKVSEGAHSEEERILATWMLEERQHLIQSLRCRLCHQLYHTGLEMIRSGKYTPNAINQVLTLCENGVKSNRLAAKPRAWLKELIDRLIGLETSRSPAKKTQLKPKAPTSLSSHPSAPATVTRLLKEYIKRTGALLSRKTPFWTELIHEGKGEYREDHVNTRWKIHVAPMKQGAGPVFRAIANVLAEEQPYCWIVPGEHQLADLAGVKDEEGHYPNRGKFLTIFPRSEEEALYLAHRLDTAIENASLPDKEVVAPCTDRPVGISGYVWAKHDQAGKPLYVQEFRTGCHANSQHGNYRLCHIVDQTSDEQNERTVDDIFEPEFGSVEWMEDDQQFRATG